MARRIITKEIFQHMFNDYQTGYSLDEMSKMYGFKKNTIKLHFNKHGVYFSNAKKFSKEELEFILFDYKNGMKPFELAKKYNRDSGTLISKLQSIGVYNAVTHRFNEKEIDFLKIYYPIGDWHSINKYLPNVSKQSIHTKMSKLGISMDSNYWIKEDENILRDKYSDMYGHIQELVDLFDNKYTYSAITSKARKMGLKTREFWSEEELKVLITKYSCCTLDEMMIYLPNRSRTAITAKALTLGLSNKIILETKFSEIDKNFISNNYNYMTDKEIGKILGRSTTAINNFRYRNGLIKIYEKSSYNDLSEYVRRNNLEWKEKSMINCKYKCVLTGNRFDDIHHTYGLNLILNETLDVLNIEIKPTMDNYTEEELNNILDVFRIKQSKYPLGVCLCKEVHMIFHNKYGYGNNTEKQWDEFVKDFKLEKYNEILNVA